MLAATVVPLVRRHLLAPLATVAVGASTVVGVAAVHVAPERSFFSDSYTAAHADALRRAIIVLMMLGGLAMAIGRVPMVAASARGGAGLREGGDSMKPRGPLGTAALVGGIVIAIAGAVMATANVFAAPDDGAFTVSLGGLVFGLGWGLSSSVFCFAESRSSEKG
jgi:hypothetical protein